MYSSINCKSCLACKACTRTQTYTAPTKSRVHVIIQVLYWMLVALVVRACVACAYVRAALHSRIKLHSLAHSKGKLLLDHCIQQQPAEVMVDLLGRWRCLVCQGLQHPFYVRPDCADCSRLAGVVGACSDVAF